MKSKHVVSMVALCTASAAAYASPLPDCHVSVNPYGARIDTPAKYELLVGGPLKNGVVNSYSKDDPVLNTPIKLLKRVPTYTPAADVKLHSSWLTNPDYRFAAGQALKVNRQMTLRDGRKFDVIVLNEGSVLFVDDEGRFCNSAGSTTNPVMLAGTLSEVPDDVAITRGSAEEVMAAGSLHIIYGGAIAGAMHFQEVWVQGTHIVKSQDRVFDQFATEVEIAGFKFSVSDAKGDQVKVKYDIPSQAEIGPEQVRAIPIHGNTLSGNR